MKLPRRARLLLALLTPLIAALGSTAPAALAGEYTLVQCDPIHRGHDAARFDRTDGAYYDLGRHCADPGHAHSLKISNLSPAPTGAEGRIAWLAPPGTTVVGARGEANLRADGGHRARLSFLDSRGEQAGRVATGRDQPSGFKPYSKRLDGVGRTGFAAHLICVDDRFCDRSAQARAWIRSVRLTLLDSATPSVGVAGSLLSGGWQRGVGELGVNVSDQGAGLRHLDVALDGKRVEPARSFSCALLPGGLARTPRPCPAEHSAKVSLDTRAAPFTDGSNRLTVCARDFGQPANQRCLARVVNVDNLAPAASFERRDPADPEMISAAVADAHSGLASVRMAYRPAKGGAWKAVPTEATTTGVRGRVDSRSEPAGRYLFRLVAVDRAGNVSISTRDRAGKQMVLEFPLLERTLLKSRIASVGHRVRYGARPRFAGRLRTAGGVALASRPVEIVERFEPGSRPMLRRHTVHTNRTGRFRLRLSRGPSRKVEARFAGDGRYLPGEARPRKLAVLGRARLRISRKRVRAGSKVRFRGRIGARGARIPAPGKVVELQVREQGKRRFRTVEDSLHSGARGVVRASYRFRRFYRSPARFRFRLKVTREANWPYRAPAHSRPRTLKVVPRR